MFLIKLRFSNNQVTNKSEKTKQKKNNCEILSIAHLTVCQFGRVVLKEQKVWAR